MEKQKTELKNLPYACTKSELVEMYIGQMRESYIISEINTIIMATRANLTSADGRPRVSRIHHKEFMEFVAIHGVPYGYLEPTYK